MTVFVSLKTLLNTTRKYVKYFASGLILKCHFMQYNFYGTELYVNVRRAVFRTQLNIYGRASLWKSQKSFIVDIWLGFKCASGVSFTVEKVYRTSIFVWHSQSQLCLSQKFITDLLVSWIFRFFVAVANFWIKTQ